jgi:hypothetical protein
MGAFMNGKLFSKMVFFIVGTFIIFIFGFIIISNFAKDARLFAKPIVAAEEDTSGLKVPISTDDAGTDENKTIKYTRAPDAKESNKDFGEGLPNSKYAATSTGGTKVKIEIANFTGSKNLSNELKMSLEAAGFEVSILSCKENKNEKTTIIERNNKKVGLEVQKVVKAGKIITAIDAKSKFDITLIIGEDYRP